MLERVGLCAQNIVFNPFVGKGFISFGGNHCPELRIIDYHCVVQSAVCGGNDALKKLARHQVQQNIDKVSERPVAGEAFHNERKILFSEKFIGNIEAAVNKVRHDVRAVEQRHHVDNLVYL